MTANVLSINEKMHALMEDIGKRARIAYAMLAEASTEQKNRALQGGAAALRKDSQSILIANEKDMRTAAKLDGPLRDRLLLNEDRIEAMAKGLEDIASLPDPVGRILGKRERPNGLVIEQMSVPLGVIGIIYESRPNVTADAGALCLKAGNAAILRGGSESLNSSAVIAACLHRGLEAAGLPKDAIQLVPTRDRAAVGEMLTMTRYIDIIIPRGGKSLTERILAESRIPTLQHLDGNCHTYIHADADQAVAKSVLLNAKMRRTGICGATESLVIDQSIASSLLPELASALTQAGCELRGDEEARQIAPMKPASKEDWETEYLDAILSVKVVHGLDEAIRHINAHGSHHTDAIITRDKNAAEEFLKKVDSAIVMHNASTQFADGAEFGMGAEIGISTGRLHARGPVGLEQLTTYKYMVRGSGQTRPA
jgi:glutamate-5-semialdehyde dehydrogenase